MVQQIWKPEFDSGGKEGLPPRGCPPATTHAPWLVSPSPYIQCIHATTIKKIFKKCIYVELTRRFFFITPQIQQSKSDYDSIIIFSVISNIKVI